MRGAAVSDTGIGPRVARWTLDPLKTLSGLQKPEHRNDRDDLMKSRLLN